MAERGTTVVVGYVDTPEGEAAIAEAANEARLRNARLIVVHSDRGGQAIDAEAWLEADESLARVTADLEDAGLVVEARDLVRGHDVAEDLVLVAREVNADLIVIGMRKRSPVGKLAMGSNAQRILLSADCPVLAVKASG